ncbi:hypothetical protein DLM45_02475 [Hyphomicrobium methylovorum]|uniref:hypothetical protein n=1 Tax=Hyphomicrobium methylovorum TaxID=84 RepID=UPI0015E646CF|nr:hypothetical protein [Hyphomicrobium methylovorum]MBA2125092.1 hypothetical protein [Hyphomicrobium methylovorum]
MVAINFQRNFAADIRSGHKTQTIRQSARCKTGDTLQLYTGQRTKNCELIGTATCAICEPITIAEDYLATGYFRLPSGDAHHIAKIDGFPNLAAMRDWFRERYGLPFQGYRVMWNDFAPAEKGAEC